ncbi:DoxX family membrane protein [Arachidicoccus sp.]|jgi:uncharacterized membrane protein YphA (DoxX/SURF4 family)|uniref:DoxX family membrane protein n=1 Tax=Arachidicoccus sp. TaxID=1872624 RepID=UPI003D245B6F
MKKNIELRIAQIIFAIPFLFFGINHLIMGSKMAGMVPISPGTFWIYLTGIAQILAAIAFIINVQAKLAAYLLSFFLLVVILSIHVPAAIKDFASGSAMLIKDIGLMGGALLLAAAHNKKSTSV